MALMNCPECGREISDKANSCPACGYPINKEKSIETGNSMDPVSSNGDKSGKKGGSSRIFFIAAGIILFILLIVIIYFKLIYRGNFDISLSNDTIELGSKAELINYLEYEPENIIEVNIINDDNFDANKTGEYSVLFSVKNKRGYIKEIPFEFQVIDTVAPELSVIKDTVYVPKGSVYDPESNVKVTDKDDYVVEISGDYDLSEEGAYDIFFVAKDNSGNISEKKSMQLIIENRDNCIIRNAKMGDSKDIIKRYETGELIGEETDETGNYFLMYEDTVEGEDAYIYYALNNKDELYQIMISFIENHTDHSIYINCFKTITEKLTNKYGEANVEKGKGILYNYCDSEAEALNIGQVKYRNTWETDDAFIILYLGKDNYEISFVLSYESEIIEKPDNSDIN